MWERAELKANAKLALKRYYWMAFLVCIIYGLLGGGTSIGFNFSFSNRVQTTVSPEEYQQFMAIFLPIFATVMLIAFVVGTALAFFVVNPLEVGLYRYFMESRTFKSDFSTLFYGFRGGRYWTVVKVQAIKTIKIWLWSLLLLIPGIIKSYEYYMIPYLLAENAGLDTERYFELSRKMTDGEKARIFLLNFSFFGWIFLGMLLCGFGVLFVNPYIYATDAELYALMRAKAFAMGFSDATELRDFLPPMPPNFNPIKGF